MLLCKYVCVSGLLVSHLRGCAAELLQLVHRHSKVLHSKESNECLNLQGHSSLVFKLRPGPKPKMISFKRPWDSSASGLQAIDASCSI